MVRLAVFAVAVTRSRRTAGAAVLIGLGCLALHPPGQPVVKPVTLQDQRKRLVGVAGMSAELVLKALGKPDEVRRIPEDGLLDGVRYGAPGAPEVERWAYGVLAKGTFARVGFVGFGRDGRVVVALSPDGFSDPAWKLPGLAPAKGDRAVASPAGVCCQVGPVEYVPAKGLTAEGLRMAVVVKNDGPTAFELKGDAATGVGGLLIVELYDATGVLLLREDRTRYHSPLTVDPAKRPVLTIPAAREESVEMVISPAQGFGRLPAGEYGLRVYFPCDGEKYYPSNLVRFELKDRPKEEGMRVPRSSSR